jgi:hypothetical protein
MRKLLPLLVSSVLAVSFSQLAAAQSTNSDAKAGARGAASPTDRTNDAGVTTRSDTGTSAGSATGSASTGTTAEGKSGARGAAAPTDSTSASTDDKARTHTGKAKRKGAKAKNKKSAQEQSSTTKSDKDTTASGAAGATSPSNSMPKKPDSSAAPMKSDSTVRSGANSPEKSEKSD